MDVFSAIVLGIVQGVTEFLPVSSTGHLILARSVLGVETSHALAFDAVLHLATAAAVIVYFWDELWLLLQTLLRKLGRLPVNERDFTLLIALMVGTIPAVVLGLSLESLMETVFRSPLVVAVLLVVGSLFFMYAEYVYQHRHHERPMSVGLGFKIGLFQCLALIPGFSRSGSTIAGGMLLGLTRGEAARFGFLLAVPVILGAGVKKCIELLSSDVVVAWVPVGIGAVVSFVVGMLAIHFMLSFVRRHTLWLFIWYRIVLAGFVVFVYTFG
ncbi:MAG: undecaprenyl-diphosphatase UppP [Candidatus Pacebacteria bacterium]|nr:undecaprenyl-diphosphatase UppP [Candidatus Paceibacterota bacterium]